MAIFFVHGLTVQVNSIWVSQLLRGYVNLLIGDWREEGDHVVVPVVTDGSHFVWKSGVGRRKPSHPLVKNGISEGVEHLQEKQRSNRGVFELNTASNVMLWTKPYAGSQCPTTKMGSLAAEWARALVPFRKECTRLWRLVTDSSSSPSGFSKPSNAFLSFKITYFRNPIESLGFVLWWGWDAPETKGGVGEIRGAVKVSDSKAAPDITHVGQRDVLGLHDAPLDDALIGAVTESHQTVVVIQTGAGNGSSVTTVALLCKSLMD